MRSRLGLGRARVVLVALAAVSVLAGGCAVGPDYVRPAVEQPAQFKSQAGGEAAPIPTDWWRLYGNPELDQLIVTANASNQSLRQAVARVDEARALARVAGSYLYPTVSADPTFSRTRYSANRDSMVTGRQVAQGVTVNN